MDDKGWGGGDEGVIKGEGQIIHLGTKLALIFNQLKWIVFSLVNKLRLCMLIIIRPSIPADVVVGSTHQVICSFWEATNLLWVQNVDTDLKGLMNGIDAFYQVWNLTSYRY